MSEIKPRADVLEAMEFMLRAKSQYGFKFKDKEAPIEALIQGITRSREDENDTHWRERELQKELSAIQERRKQEINKQMSYFEALNKLVSLEDFHKIYERAVDTKKN